MAHSTQAFADEANERFCILYLCVDVLHLDHPAWFGCFAVAHIVVERSREPRNYLRRWGAQPFAGMLVEYRIAQR